MPFPPNEKTHVGPNGSAWTEAQREMSARNDATKRAGKQERAEQERRAAVRRAARDAAAGVYR
jgi:hypothetical protein